MTRGGAHLLNLHTAIYRRTASISDRDSIVGRKCERERDSRLYWSLSTRAAYRVLKKARSLGANFERSYRPLASRERPIRRSPLVNPAAPPHAPISLTDEKRRDR